jgi:hypothetical protein
MLLMAQGVDPAADSDNGGNPAGWKQDHGFIQQGANEGQAGEERQHDRNQSGL